jgi:outer membrane protein OmpA-like peptidoglycan-associated protein
MKTMSTAAAAATGAALALALAGCTTIENARARIVKAPARCPDQTVDIYFEPQSAEVTPEGRAVIAAAANGAQGCAVRRVEVLGLADAAGAPEANLELSKRRAQSVTAALAGAGLPPAEFRVTAGGQAGSVTAGGQAAPLRRRVDVVLHLSPR